MANARTVSPKFRVLASSHEHAEEDISNFVLHVQTTKDLGNVVGRFNLTMRNRLDFVNESKEVKELRETKLSLGLSTQRRLRFEFKDELRGTRLPTTGGNTIWLGPTTLVSPNPQWMFKTGIQFPIYENLNGHQEHSEFRASFGIEHHF